MNIKNPNVNSEFKGDKINMQDIKIKNSDLNISIEGKLNIKESIINSPKNQLEINNNYEKYYGFNESIDGEIKKSDTDNNIISLDNSSQGDRSNKNKYNIIEKNIIIDNNSCSNINNLSSSEIRNQKNDIIKPEEIINYINPEMPPNLPNKQINNVPKEEDDLNNYIYIEEDKNLQIINNYYSERESLNKELYRNINPEGPDSEIYKQNILLGQKILIVMVYYEYSCNIYKLFYNEENKTVKDAVSHFGIEIITVNNYVDAIKELTKDENGKCPYYACWLLNNLSITPQTNQFLEILMKFWKNGGAVILLSDNTPFIVETNLFLSMINANFIMEGNYIGQKDIYGDDTGLLNKPALFNRNKNIYKYNNIQRQGLCHNLYNIYEGVTISSVTKDNKRKMDVNQNDVKPFIPFARDSEGGITSLIKLANDYGEGDLIIDGGFTKLFINMKESGTFRYIQNIAGFTSRPEIHLLNNILPKDYRPKKVSL